jgi:DnaK suppressor protein
MAKKKDRKAKKEKKEPRKGRPAKPSKTHRTASGKKPARARTAKARPAVRSVARAAARISAKAKPKVLPAPARKGGASKEPAGERGAPARPQFVAVGPANATVFKLSPSPDDKVGKSELTIPREARKKMSHIDDATMGKIVAKLDEMRIESQGVVRQHVTNDLEQQKEVSDVGDDLDQAVTERDREFDLIMHQRHLRRLQQVQDAFMRIQEGTYGFCEGTEEPINPRRLIIMPLARFSLEYQEQQEKMLGRSPEDNLGGEESFAAEE